MHNPREFDELSAAEQRVIDAIRNDPVPVVSQAEINAVCKAASFYCAEKQSVWHRGFWRVVFSCHSAEAVFFWVISAFLLGSCVTASLLSKTQGIDPIAFMTALAPVPVIAFAIRELQYRDGSLVQIEKTCKYDPKKIYFARLWLGMLLNAVFVLLAGTIAFPQYGHIVQLYLCSFIAMFFVGAAALFLMSLTKNVLPLSLTMSAWVLCSIYFLSENAFVPMVTQMNIWYLAGILLAGMGVFAVVTMHTTRKLYA